MHIVTGSSVNRLLVIYMLTMFHPEVFARGGITVFQNFKGGAM